jgi:glycosyltransferase involved in cell wall biosynthesis
LHLIGLVEAPDHVCCRYRLNAFRASWERDGHALVLASWPRRWLGWPSLLAKTRQADAVIVQRKLPTRWQLHFLRRNAKLLLFDFDDAVFGRDSYSTKGIPSTRRQSRFQSICAAADVVIAGNAFLGKQAVRWTTSSRVHVIPTCVDPDAYPLARHESRDIGAQLVWVGSSSTLQSLESIRHLLNTLGQTVPGLQLKLVCNRSLHLEHLPVMPVTWSEATEANELASADIGISWMPDDDWSRGKCGLKLLQYMAAGLPVVANPIGVHKEIVLHGKTGFLADAAEEWQNAVGQLATDPALRRRMGAAGRRRLEADYSVERGAAKWRNVLSSLQVGRAAA